MDSHEQFAADVAYELSKLNSGTASEIDLAEQLYRTYNNPKVAYSATPKVFAVSSLHLAKKILTNPTTLRKITDETGTDMKRVTNVQKKMQTALVKDHDISIPQYTAADYITQYCDKLDLSSDLEDAATSVLDKTEHVIQNCTEPTKAAASIYLAAQLEQEDVNQKQLADVSGVTEVTIRNRYKQQQDEMSVM